jgi:hypothetical protein
MEPMVGETKSPWWRRHRRKLIALVVVLGIGPATHVVVGATTPIAPPAITLPAGTGGAYTRVRAGVREVYLEGTPEQIGSQHARLLRDRMVANEAELWNDFTRFVPLAPARTILMDVSRVRYRHVDRGFPDPRRRELAAEARAFEPDPYAFRMPTFQRMVFLHALYDIALSFEHSPLIGCTAFGLGAGATDDGHVLLARAFDFEAGEVFDRDKAVFFVKGDGVIPFASVAWPGLVGAMSGMNLEGVAVIVNGARAGEPQTEGMPVIYSLRDVLERAHDTGEAIAILRDQRPMVSHIVFVADARGRFAVVERAPGFDAFVRESWTDPDRVAVTNHLEGPLASDPKNQVVRNGTTTLARRARIDELVSAVGAREGNATRAIAILRDHSCAGGQSCALGDRRTIDALIATHGIVADTTDRALWVSAGPHLSGRFVRFDLRAIFAADHDPARDPEPAVIAEDPILGTPEYQAGRARAGGPRVGGDAP